MKKFLYDTLLDKENICNLTQERDIIEKFIENKKKLVIYGPRNFGKTSLVKNDIIPKFRKKHKRSFVFFTDLMEVKSLNSIDLRMVNDFGMSFSESFPVKNFIDNVKRFLTGLHPEITFDPNTGEPKISIASSSTGKSASVLEIFKAISKIADEKETLIVLDEFQDIAFVEEAEGIFRRAFQEIKKTSIIVMGSKRHILSEIVAKPGAPLSMFGEDLEFKPIEYKEYQEYILERFKQVKLNISFDDSIYLQEKMLRVPEAINIVCAEIMNSESDKTVVKLDIDKAINAVVEKRRSRYEEYLSHFTENEESVLASIAKEGYVKHPNSQAFLKTVKPTSRMVGLIVKQFYDGSVVDKGDSGYFLTDPLLTCYLKYHR